MGFRHGASLCCVGPVPGTVLRMAPQPQNLRPPAFLDGADIALLKGRLELLQVELRQKLHRGLPKKK